MESAIPQHLRCPRTRHRRVPDEYVPPVEAFVARHGAQVTRVVMAYFGVQYTQDRAAAEAALADRYHAFAQDNGPGHHDRARWVDERGASNVILAAYWDDPARFDLWFAKHGSAWTRELRPGVGTYTEVLRPKAEHYETLFSVADRPEGIALLADNISAPIMEHAYWGGARDRIPASQTDPMLAVGEPVRTQDGLRVTVQAHDNLCLIRSGQDWIDTEAGERAMYLNEMEPVLDKGMRFLRDDGRAIGCYANRYVTVEDAQGKPIEKSYGMSWWRSLDALERWAESHPTHVAIFGGAMQYFAALGPATKLRLYHEVTVAHADEQFFEYLNCHERTGLLGSFAPSGDGRR